jgi:mannosyltransferase OCH1-like enzyme
MQKIYTENIIQMKTETLIKVGIYIVVFVIICFLFYTFYERDPLSDLYTIVKSKQTISSLYYPPSQPKPSVVPMKLFQTWHTKDLPPKMQENVQNIKKQNPELEYFLYDDNDCIDFIKKHFPDEVVNAYNTLLPGAYKADLWRYCVLYIHGGVYIDIKYQCVDGFKFIHIMDREHFVLERPNHWKPETYGIYNALIISKPGNPLLLKSIEDIVQNTQTNYYGFNALYPTGPGLLGELYFGNIVKNMSMIDNFDLVYNIVDTQDVIIYKNQIVLQSYPEYRKEQRTNQKHKHYNYLWLQRAIYIY